MVVPRVGPNAISSIDSNTCLLLVSIQDSPFEHSYHQRGQEVLIIRITGIKRKPSP